MARVSNNKLLNEVKNFRASQDLQIDALNNLNESFSKTRETTAQFNDNLTSLNDLIGSMIESTRKHDLERAERDRASRIKEDSDRVSHAMKKLTSRFIDAAKVIADTANKYSQISNDLITVTGASGKEVRETRSEIVHDIISQINRETGNFLNPEKSYQKVVDIANQANIGNLEAIEAITRPMLIASETMNIKNDELASLFNKWYTRYNFSTLQMEDMVDEIRGNTAGNNATAQATMENISKFQNFIGVYADSTSEMQNMVEAISQESSRLESVGINSGYIFDYMKQIGIGDFSNATSIMSLLNNSGTGINWTEAQKLLRSGNAEDMKLVSDALSRGAQAIGEKVKDSAVPAEAIKAYGLDVDEIYNILSASGILMNSDEFMNSVSGVQSAVESLDDKFNTHSDKLKNIFSGLSEHFANLQENLGVGISDIIQTLGLIYTAVQFRNVIGGVNRGEIQGGVRGLLSPISSIGMNTAVRGAASTSMMANGLSSVGMTGASDAMLTAGTGLSKVAGLGGGLGGAAMLAGGLTAGGALTWDGVSTLVDNGADQTEKVWAGVEAAGGAGGVAGLIALGATNPVGWVALAIGGIGFLGKKAYENAHELSGNAEKVSNNIETIGKSLEKENRDRLSAISDLRYKFNQESDLEEQKNLMLQSGLFVQEDIQDKETTELSNMIDSYKNAASAINEVTDGILKTAEMYYSDKQDTEQKDFMKKLKEVSSSSDRYQILELLKSGIEDEDLIKTINEYQEDHKISDKEWKDVIYGGKNAWFDKTNLTDQSVDPRNMQLVAGYLGWDDVFTTTDNMGTLAKIQNALMSAGTKTEYDEAIKELVAKGLRSEYQEIYGSPKLIGISKGYYTDRDNFHDIFPGYRKGSNYIESDQFANIHEGEAVIPKEYNPSANVTELEMLRTYYKDSINKENKEYSNVLKDVVLAIRESKVSSKKESTSDNTNSELDKRHDEFSRGDTDSLSVVEDIASVLFEIKDFLSNWREDNNRREDIEKNRNRLTNSSYIARYLQNS